MFGGNGVYYMCVFLRECCGERELLRDSCIALGVTGVVESYCSLVYMTLMTGSSQPLLKGIDRITCLVKC